MLNLKPHEELFEVKPIGVRCKCEFCNEGEMKLDDPRKLNAQIDQDGIYFDNMMYRHKCTKCGKTMLLPKIYPYIEWSPEDYKKDN